MKVKIRLNDVNWHFSPERPDRDCRVWAVKEWLSSPTELIQFIFTVEGGWNTHRDSKGKLHTESAFEPNVTAWTYDDLYSVEVENED